MLDSTQTGALHGKESRSQNCRPLVVIVVSVGITGILIDRDHYSADDRVPPRFLVRLIALKSCPPPSSTFTHTHTLESTLKGG